MGQQVPVNQEREDLPAKDKNKHSYYNLVAYLSLSLLYVLIILYAVFSQSLPSAIAVLFMTVSIILNIAGVAQLSLKNIDQKAFDWTQVKPYPTDRVIWALFILVSGAFFIAKVVLYYTGAAEEWPQQQQSMMQIQSPLWVFLPLVLIPFAVGTLFLHPKSKLLKQYTQRINPYTILPYYLVLITLMLLIQIFSISIAGLVYFFLAAYLYWMKGFNFKDKQFKILLILVQILTTLMIVLNYLATIQQFQTSTSIELFQFFGINGIIDFLQDPMARGHIICEALLALFAAYLNRLFNYQSFNAMCKEQSSQFEDPLRLKKKESGETNRQVGVTGVYVPYRRAQSDIQQTDKVRFLAKQIELGNISGRHSARSDPEQPLLNSPERRSRRNNDKMLNDIIPFEHQQVDQDSAGKKKQSMEQTVQKWQKLNKKVLQGVNTIFSFLNSPQFSLRVIQLLAIIIIQRNNTIYSLVSLLWLAAVSAIQNPKIVVILTAFVMLPLELANFIITYFFNIPNSPAQNATNAQAFGLQSDDLMWLDVILFNLFFSYVFLYLKSYHQLKNKNMRYQKPFTTRPRTWQIVIAYLFRYSYMLTLIAMFFLGFSNPTLMNIILVALFLLFFSKGDSLAIFSRKKNGKDQLSLTTFCKRFWLIIVYYVLVCIVAKYIYSLFFLGDLEQQLQPTGINQDYNWSFNFSLTSQDPSNTTPWFIIFVLAQMQVIIYRSQLYNSLSFSIMNYMIKDEPLEPRTVKQKRKKKLFNFFIMMNQIYYQSIYYVSGIVIVGCSYRWSFIGLAIIVLAIIALLISFSKTLIVSILFLNLTFLFLNYLVILLNHYTVVIDFFSQEVVDVINKIALGVGFSLEDSSYISLFILNVVILYFTVLCYSLASILNTPLPQAPQQPIQPQITKKSLLVIGGSIRGTVDDYKSMFDGSVFDPQIDETFIYNYQKGVIAQVQVYYKQNLVKKYEWLRKMGQFMTIFWTDIVTIFVIIECLFFRLSVSMFLFLACYMIFYFFLFDRLGHLFLTSGYYKLIQKQLDSYSGKQELLQDQQEFKNMVHDRQGVLQSQTEMRIIVENSQLLKNQFKKIIWKYSAVLSASCLILTYSSQFLISDFYSTYINISQTQDFEIILFILGINVNPDQNVGLYIYFYYVMLIINVIEKLILNYIQKVSLFEVQIQGSSLKKTVQELPTLENPIYLINSHVEEPFIEQLQIFQELDQGIQSAINPVFSILADLGRQYYQQANILIYFSYKYVLFKVNWLMGSLSFMIRLYLWLMLLNVYAKSNIFAFGYLIAVVFFWLQPVGFDQIRNINKAAIILLLLQYIMLLLDINTVTSPLPLPYNHNLSLLQYLIADPQWVDFLAVSSQDQTSNTFLLSFIVNSIIIFLTQICFTIFTMLSQIMMKNIFTVYLKYQNMIQKLVKIQQADPIIINYSNYQHTAYRVFNYCHELVITSSHLVVALLMFILLAGVDGYLAVVLLTIAFVYIYVGIFSKLSQEPAIYSYTAIYFRIFNLLQFICLLITTVLQIPVIQENQDLNNVIKQLGALTSIQQLILMLLIQLWLDLHASHQFQDHIDSYHKQSRIRQQVFLRSVAFQRNNFLIDSLINQYKQLLTFDISIAQAIQIIKQWHSVTNKELKIVDYDFQVNNYNKTVLKQIQNEQAINERKQFTDVISTIIKEFTDISLVRNYIETTHYLSDNVYAIVFQGDLVISCWSFIKEDYAVVNQFMEEYDRRSKQIVEEIGEADEQEAMEETLTGIREQFMGNKSQEPVKIRLETPDKLVINIEPQQSHNRISRYIIPFLLSNIQTLVVLLGVIYYTLNPCLLSLPLLAYLFCYYTIATRKYIYIMVIYIFLLILTSQLVYLIVPEYDPSQDTVIKFLFATDPPTGQIYYNQPYLYFLFVVVFLSQEVIKYKGNWYRSELEVQNLQQGLLRILMNQGEGSNKNIWKYGGQQQMVVGQYNPFNIANQEIDQNIDKLIINDSLFDQVFSNRKVGLDLYPPIAAVQIFLMIYLIFFYPLMTNVNGYTLEDTTKYYQFSSDMVVGVLVHVASMIIERYIAIAAVKRSSKVIAKYFWTLWLFLLLCWFIYYIAPYKTGLTGQGSLYGPSRALIAFAFFYFIYFYLSALQVKYGYKEVKSLNSLMTRRGFANYYAVSVYTAIPFLYQLKIIIDWTFTNTSLTLFDWFRQFSIYLRAFKAKIQYFNATGIAYHQPQPWTSKIIGWVGFILILIIIFGPMVLFSGLNPIAQTNLVVSGSLSVALQVKGGNSFPLYSTSHFSNPPTNYTQATFNAAGFNNVPTLQQMNSGDIPQQFQSVTYEPFSDSNWGIATPNYQELVSMLDASISQLKNNQTANNSFQIVTTYQLNREVAETISSSTQFVYPFGGLALALNQLQQLQATLTVCNASAVLPGFYNSLIRLNTIGTTYKPRPILFVNGSTLQQPYVYNVTLNLFCPKGQQIVADTNDVYWGLYLNNSQSEGLALYVYCDKYQNIIGGYGFTALYTSIILVIAGFVRSMFDGNMPLIPYEMNPRPDNIIRICEAISTLRIRNLYRQQYLMYYQLIDLIRSPQIMKYMSGSYPYLIEKAYTEREREERLKELEKNKTI